MAVLAISLLLAYVALLASSKLNSIPKRVPQVNLNSFLKKYFTESYTNVVISDYHDDLTSASEELLFRTKGAEVKSFLDTLDQIPRTFVIFPSDSNDLSELFGSISESSKGLPGASTYIILTREEELVEDFAQTLWKFKLPFSFILAYKEAAAETKVFNLNIWNCGSNISSSFISSLNEGSELSTIHEWNFKSQFAGCPIYALWTVMPPYVNEVNSSRQGIFVEFLDAITSIGNRSIVYRPYEPVYLQELSVAYNFATLLEDLDGEFGQLFVGPVNIHVSLIFDISPILIDNSLLFLVPMPYTSLTEQMLRPQLITLAIGYITLIVTMVVMLYYMAKNTVDSELFSSIMKTYFLFSGPIFGISSMHRLPKTRSLQIYVGAFLLQSMTISTFIQGSIVSELSGTIYGDPIESNDDLLNSNIPIKTISGLVFLFRIGFHKRDGEIYDRIQALDQDEYPFQAGNMAVEKKDFATIVDTGYIIMRPNILRSFSVFEVYGMKQNLAMPKNSYFTPQYNEWIGRLMEIGILSKFIKLYQYFYALKFYVEEDKRSFVVTLEQLLPTLSIVGAGYCMALLAFFIELAVDRWQTIGRSNPLENLGKIHFKSAK